MLCNIVLIYKDGHLSEPLRDLHPLEHRLHAINRIKKTEKPDCHLKENKLEIDRKVHRLSVTLELQGYF